MWNQMVQKHTQKKVKKALARVVIWNWNLFLVCSDYYCMTSFTFVPPGKKVAFVLFLTYDSPVTLGLSSLIFLKPDALSLSFAYEINFPRKLFPVSYLAIILSSHPAFYFPIVLLNSLCKSSLSSLSIIFCWLSSLPKYHICESGEIWAMLMGFGTLILMHGLFLLMQAFSDDNGRGAPFFPAQQAWTIIVPPFSSHQPWCGPFLLQSQKNYWFFTLVSQPKKW